MVSIRWPAVPHLDTMASKGVFVPYPDLRARGSNADPEAACYLRPKIFEILGGWIKGSRHEQRHRGRRVDEREPRVEDGLPVYGLWLRLR